MNYFEELAPNLSTAYNMQTAEMSRQDVAAAVSRSAGLMDLLSARPGRPMMKAVDPASSTTDQQAQALRSAVAAGYDAENKEREGDTLGAQESRRSAISLLQMGRQLGIRRRQEAAINARMQADYRLRLQAEKLEAKGNTKAAARLRARMGKGSKVEI